MTVLLNGCDKPKPAPPPPATVAVAHPLARKIVDWDDYIGRFEASKRVDVRSRVNGVVTELHFRDGQMVQAGQLLFVIDPRPYEALLAAARADAARASATLALARSRSARDAGLLQLQGVSKEEYDSRVAEVRTDAAMVQQAEATVQSRALDVEFTRVTAPISGRVSDRRVDVGNLVTGGDLSSASLLTTIVAIDPIYFSFDAAEALYLKYVRQNKEGSRPSSRGAANPVEIRLQDEPDYRWKGRMDFVDNALDTSSGTIRGRAVVANPDGFLTPGMFGRMRLLGSGAYDALLIPDSAVLTDQTRSAVMLVGADGTVSQRVVELGPLVDGLRIVRRGIGAGDSVVIRGLQRATPGGKVKPQPATIEPPGAGNVPDVDAFAPPPASEATSVSSP